MRQRRPLTSASSWDAERRSPATDVAVTGDGRSDGTQERLDVAVHCDRGDGDGRTGDRPGQDADSDGPFTPSGAT